MTSKGGIVSPLTSTGCCDNLLNEKPEINVKRDYVDYFRSEHSPG